MKKIFLLLMISLASIYLVGCIDPPHSVPPGKLGFHRDGFSVVVFGRNYWIQNGYFYDNLEQEGEIHEYKDYERAILRTFGDSYSVYDITSLGILTDEEVNDFKAFSKRVKSDSFLLALGYNAEGSDVIVIRDYNGNHSYFDRTPYYQTIELKLETTSIKAIYDKALLVSGGSEISNEILRSVYAGIYLHSAYWVNEQRNLTFFFLDGKGGFNLFDLEIDRCRSY
jgi:hypothetical protein